MLFLGWQNIIDILVSHKTQSEEVDKTIILAVNKKNKLVFKSVKQVRSWVKNKKFLLSANHSKESISLKPFEQSTMDQYKAINHIRDRRHIAQCPITQWLRSLSGPAAGWSKLTCYAQVDERACLVLSVPLIHSLHVVSPGVTCFCSKDHQLILQCDGSVSETRHSVKPTYGNATKISSSGQQYSNKDLNMGWGDGSITKLLNCLESLRVWVQLPEAMRKSWLWCHAYNPSTEEAEMSRPLGLISQSAA